MEARSHGDRKVASLGLDEITRMIVVERAALISLLYLSRISK
jgi:hypothetical protein